MNEQQNQILKLIRGGEIALYLYIVSLIISLLLLYNQKQSIEGKEPFLSLEENRNLLIFNKLLLLGLIIYFLYGSFKAIEIAKNNEANQEQLNDLYIQLAASFLSLISSLLVTYVVLKNNLPSASNYENPEI